jgi:hypothetical protein
VSSCLWFQVRANLSACGGQSTGWSQTVRVEPAGLVFFVFVVCSYRLRFDPFRPVFMVARGLADGLRGELGQSARRGRSASRGQTVCFLRCATGDSGTIFGQSATSLRTVRLVPADSPPLLVADPHSG